MLQLEDACIRQQPRPGGHGVAHIGAVGPGADASRAADMARSAMGAGRGPGSRRVAADDEIHRPAVPSQPLERTGDAPPEESDGRQRQGRTVAVGPFGVAGSPSEADAAFVERIPGRELLAGERPVVRHPVFGEHPEISGPESGGMSRPVDRAPADPVAEHRFDRRRIVLDRVVGGGAPDIRVGAQRTLQQVCTGGFVGRHPGVVEPVSTLYADDPETGAGQPPSGRGASWSGADNRYIGRDVGVHEELAPVRWSVYLYNKLTCYPIDAALLNGGIREVAAKREANRSASAVEDR